MRTAGVVAAAALLLLWPALLNGYPLVYSDTGTYLSQAINHYLGWDRPIFYSLFLLPLHMELTTWPAIAVQALLVAYMLHLMRHTLRPEWPDWSLVPLTGALAMASSLPFVTAELMPDLFTSLLVLALGLLIFVPDRLSRGERFYLVGFVTFTTAAHFSNLPLAVLLLIGLVPLRRWLGAAAPLGRTGLAQVMAPPVLAAAAMIAVNFVGYRAPSLAPFGNVFLLARVLYDGPGMDALARDCPRTGWLLCNYRGQFPATADGFLWRENSPLIRAGGAKRVSSEANSVIAAAIRAEPAREALAILANGARQLMLFSTGEGLQPWPATVTPWIERDFPAFERTEYKQARQTEGLPLFPPWMPRLHAAASLAGVAALLALLPGALRRQRILAGFAVAVLLALLGNALITGALSGPHDRYQSRVMWLPPLIALLAAPPLLADRKRAADASSAAPRPAMMPEIRFAGSL